MARSPSLLGMSGDFSGDRSLSPDGKWASQHVAQRGHTVEGDLAGHLVEESTGSEAL